MRGNDEAPGPRGEIRSLTKGLAIVKLFDPSHPEWTIEEIARKTGYPRPTAYRLVKTLEMNDFLATGVDEKHYHLGPALAASHYLVANRLHLEKVLHQDLEALAAATGETSNLMIDVGPMGGMHVDSVPGLAPIHLAPTLGYIDFCLAASSGKVLAAFRDDREIEFLLSTRLMRYTAHTIVDADAVRAELMKVRETGIAVDIQESSESICGVSAPIHNSAVEVVAVVSVVMVAERFPSNADELLRAVRRAGENMSARLGYRPPQVTV